MDPTERFTELVQQPDAEILLDEAALCIAAHDHPVDVAANLAQIDELARRAPADAEALARFLFVDEGFAGNEADYGDPRNSFLDQILGRHLGLPITLSIVMLEVGRRRGLALAGVGMPGHFLVGDRSGGYYDPFHRGVPLDEDGCRLVFETTRGAAQFRPEYLAPVGRRMILARVLANLVHTFLGRDLAAAAWVVRLRLRVPGLGVADRREAAALLGSLGHFAEGAAELDSLGDQLEGDAADSVAREAASLRARAN